MTLKQNNHINDFSCNFSRIGEMDQTGTWTVNASFNSNEVHNVLNDSSDMMWSWTETSLIVGGKPADVHMATGSIQSDQTPCFIQDGFSQQLPPLHSSTAEKLGCWNFITPKEFKYVLLSNTDVFKCKCNCFMAMSAWTILSKNNLDKSPVSSIL